MSGEKAGEFPIVLRKLIDDLEETGQDNMLDGVDMDIPESIPWVEKHTSGTCNVCGLKATKRQPADFITIPLLHISKKQGWLVCADRSRCRERIRADQREREVLSRTKLSNLERSVKWDEVPIQGRRHGVR